MKTKKAILTATFILTVSACSLQPAVTVSANSRCAIEQTGNSVSPQSDIKEWIYKIENGKKYKRLYNASTATWETDWIYIGDV